MNKKTVYYHHKMISNGALITEEDIMIYKYYNPVKRLMYLTEERDIIRILLLMLHHIEKILIKMLIS